MAGFLVLGDDVVGRTSAYSGTTASSHFSPERPKDWRLVSGV
jgi:hypothetical protein